VLSGKPILKTAPPSTSPHPFSLGREEIDEHSGAVGSLQVQQLANPPLSGKLMLHPARFLNSFRRKVI
jgi:hypothetical protein